MPKKVERQEVQCPCGKVFTAAPWQIRAGRGKRCSKECQYKYPTRPTGLKYEINKENPSWFKPGEVQFAGADHPEWKGEGVGYEELHRWVRRNKTKTGTCEHCGEEKHTEWANRSHEYRRDLDDWLELCQPCHGKYDSGQNRGSMKKKYGQEPTSRERKK